MQNRGDDGMIGSVKEDDKSDSADGIQPRRQLLSASVKMQYDTSVWVGKLSAIALFGTELCERI